MPFCCVGYAVTYLVCCLQRCTEAARVQCVCRRWPLRVQCLSCKSIYSVVLGLTCGHVADAGTGHAEAGRSHVCMYVQELRLFTAAAAAAAGLASYVVLCRMSHALMLVLLAYRTTLSAVAVICWDGARHTVWCLGPEFGSSSSSSSDRNWQHLVLVCQSSKAGFVALLLQQYVVASVPDGRHASHTCLRLCRVLC